jgi:hypothetical protein
MRSAIDTSIHRGGTLHGQRYLSLGRKAKRDGSCTQNAAEERSCSGSYRFRHCDLLSKPPHKVMTPHVELALTHVKNTAGADRGQDRCFTSAQEDTGEYGSIRSRLVKHFRSKNSAIGQNNQKRTFDALGYGLGVLETNGIDKPQFIGSRDLPRITPPIAGIYRTNPACAAMQVWPQLRRNEESCHCGSHDWPLHTHIPRVVRVRPSVQHRRLANLM